MPTHTAALATKSHIFVRVKQIGSRTIAWSVEAIRHSRELEGEAEAEIVITVVRLVVVAVSDAAVLRIVVPAAAANHAVDALTAIDLMSLKKYLLPKPFGICVLNESQ